MTQPPEVQRMWDLMLKGAGKEGDSSLPAKAQQLVDEPAWAEQIKADLQAPATAEPEAPASPGRGGFTEITNVQGYSDWWRGVDPADQQWKFIQRAERPDGVLQGWLDQETAYKAMQQPVSTTPVPEETGAVGTTAEPEPEEAPLELPDFDYSLMNEAVANPELELTPEEAEEIFNQYPVFQTMIDELVGETTEKLTAMLDAEFGSESEADESESVSE